MTGIISTTPTGSEGGASGIFGMRGISNQYFFKSQESLATVIDTVSDNDENEGDDNDKTKDDKSGQNNNAPLAETEDTCDLETKEKCENLGKVTTV